MTATIIDGKATAATVRAGIADAVAALGAAHGLAPGLAVVLVGDDPASQVYVRNKTKATRDAGMTGFEHRLAADTAEADVIALVSRLNADPSVHGILVQLPLPDHIDASRVIAAIDPAKDVDGLHVVNVGRLLTGWDRAMVPCTPLGCMKLLADQRGDLGGLNATVVGRSNLVGKPVMLLLMQANCTVTVAHSRTRDLADICRGADVLVAAVGRPHMIPGDWIKPGATVIDVGINRVTAEDGTSRLVGDVVFDEAVEVAGAVTPVPGGVGPMTIAMLMRNTLAAACRQHGLDDPAL